MKNKSAIKVEKKDLPAKKSGDKKVPSVIIKRDSGSGKFIGDNSGAGARKDSGGGQTGLGGARKK